jgi:hypothetical protein
MNKHENCIAVVIARTIVVFTYAGKGVAFVTDEMLEK